MLFRSEIEADEDKVEVDEDNALSDDQLANSDVKIAPKLVVLLMTRHLMLPQPPVHQGRYNRHDLTL